MTILFCHSKPSEACRVITFNNRFDIKFLLMLHRVINSPFTGALGCLISIVWEGFWLVGPPVGLNGNDRGLYLRWGLVALAISCFQAFYTLIRENRRLKSELDEKQKIRKARELIGKMLEQIASYELDAYNGSDGGQYDKLYQKIEQVKRDVTLIATEYLDASFKSRFLAVNVLDVQLDEATRFHFISRAQGDFWTMYQQLKGWRSYLEKVFNELNR